MIGSTYVAPPTYYTAVVIGEFIAFSQPLCSQMNCVVLDFIHIVVVFFHVNDKFFHKFVSPKINVLSSIPNCLFI